MRGLNLDQIRTFADVVALGSFSAAAVRLGISQPAVSLQVRQLEKRFGVKLIERVGRRVAPTAAGAEFLSHARQVEAAVDAAAEAMAPHAAGATGRVRLGTGATACIYLLPPLLRDLRQRFPTLEISVSTGNTPDMLRAIEENRIDVGLLTLPAAGRALDIRPLMDDEFVLVAPRGSVLPRDITAAELARMALVQYELGANTRRLTDAWAMRAGISLKPVMELGSVEAIKELVGAGLGCSVLPRMAIRAKEAERQFVVRSLKPRLYRKLALVLRRDKPLTRGLREVVRAIAALGGR
jgi:DNA-binding transcriptional LysR family regulator